MSVRTAWPVNPGAYVRTAVAVPATGFVAYLAQASATPETVAAFAVAAFGDLGALLGNERWRAAFSWVGTALAAFVLAAASYEGEPAINLSTFGQLDQTDLAAIVALTVKSLLVTFVPNAPPVYPATAHEDTVIGDVVAPEALADDDDHVAVEGVTHLMPALTPELIAAHAAASAPAPAPAVRLPEETDLDPAPPAPAIPDQHGHHADRAGGVLASILRRGGTA